MMGVSRDHGYAQENLSAYLDGELTAREHQRVERHLAQCAACRDELASLCATVALVRQAPCQPLPCSFVLPPSAQVQQRSYRRWNWAFSAVRSASVVVTLLLVMLVSSDLLIGRGMVPLMANRKAANPVTQSETNAFPPASAPVAAAQPALTEPLQDEAADTAPLAAAPAPKVLAIETTAEKSQAPASPAEPSLEIQAIEEAPVALVPVEPESRPAAKGGEGMGGGGVGGDLGRGGGEAPPLPQTSGARAVDGAQPIPTVIEVAPTPEPTPVEEPPAAKRDPDVAPASAPAALPAPLLAPAPTQVVEPTPAPAIAMQAPQPQPTSVTPKQAVIRESEPPSEAPRLVYDIWAVVRRATAVFFGLLLILLAVLLVISQKRRV